MGGSLYRDFTYILSIMDLINLIENLVTQQLLAVCIFQFKGMANEVASVEVDGTTGSLVTIQ